MFRHLLTAGSAMLGAGFVFSSSTPVQFGLAVSSALPIISGAYFLGRWKKGQEQEAAQLRTQVEECRRALGLPVEGDRPKRVLGSAVNKIPKQE